MENKQGQMFVSHLMGFECFVTTGLAYAHRIIIYLSVRVHMCGIKFLKSSIPVGLNINAH